MLASFTPRISLIASSSLRKTTRSTAIGVLLTLTAVTTVTAGTVGPTGIDASGNYQQERAWCMSNMAGEARVDCLKNSAAAQDAKRRGTLDTSGADIRANALLRCQAFAGEDRVACKTRVEGRAESSGSVLGGGVITRLETTVPAEPSSQTSGMTKTQ